MFFPPMRSSKLTKGDAPSPGQSLLAELKHRQTAPTPVLQLDLLDHHEGGVERLAQHIQQELADTGDEPCLSSAVTDVRPRTGSFPCDLNADDRHGDPRR